MLQMLHALLPGFPIPNHHSRGGFNPEFMCTLHHIEPLLRVAFGAPLPPDLIDQNLASTSGETVQPRVFQLSQDINVTFPESFRHPIDLGRREAMEMYSVPIFQFAEQPGVVIEWQVGMQSTLHQDAASAEFDHLFDLSEDLVITQDVALRITRLAIERAKVTDRKTDVRVIDIAIDDICDGFVGM